MTLSSKFLGDMAAVAAASGRFGHRERLELTWRYVRRCGSEEAGDAIGEGLARLADAQNRPYDPDETRFWVDVVTRATELHPDLDFDELVSEHPHLLDTRLPELAPLLRA
jgi:hypothetical protein